MLWDIYKVRHPALTRVSTIFDTHTMQPSLGVGPRGGHTILHAPHSRSGPLDLRKWMVVFMGINNWIQISSV